MGKWFALERGIRNLYQVQEVKHDCRRELFFGWLDCGAFVRNRDGLVKEVTPGSVALEKIQGGVMGWWIVGAFAWVLVVIGICLFVSINKSEDD